MHDNPEPNSFSFNSQRVCKSCNGLGFNKVDVNKIIPNPKISIKNGISPINGERLMDNSSNRIIGKKYGTLILLLKIFKEGLNAIVWN